MLTHNKTYATEARLKRIFLQIFLLVHLLVPAAAWSLPLKPTKGNFHPQQAVLPPDFTADFDFEGIVALSNCSGALVRLEISKDTDQALVFTNGHCLETGFMRPGEAVVNRASRRTFSLMNSAAQSAGRLNATKIIYATMTRTDMAIYQVRETYKEIKERMNINPLTLSAKAPSIKDSMEVISGYWRRGYRCGVEAIIYQLKEGAWTFEESFRYSRPGCEVIHGTSGSPVVLAGSRTMIGINNTGNDDGEACTDNNPCEVDQNGNISYQKGYSYGQQTYWLYGCLNQNTELDLNKPGCMLPH